MTRTRTLASVIVILVLVLLVSITVSSVFAKSKREGILIEDIVYTIGDLPVPDYLVSEDKRLFEWLRAFYAEGEGTLNCNDYTACEEAGFDGQTVTIQQGFQLMTDDLDAGQFKVITAGRMQLPGELPAIGFTGRGRGTAERNPDGTYDVTMELEARTKRGGGKLSFSLVGFNIDHTSAGIVLDSLEGSCVLSEDEMLAIRS